MCRCSICCSIPDGCAVPPIEWRDRLARLYPEIAWGQALLDAEDNLVVLLDAKQLFNNSYFLSEHATEVIYRLSPAVVTAEWRMRNIPMNFNCADIADETTPPLAIAKLRSYDHYTPAPPGLREIFQLHPMHVLYACEHRDEVLASVVAVNNHMYSYEHAAIMLWWVLLPYEHFDHFVKMRLHRVNLRTQHAALAQKLEICRQQGATCECELGVQGFHYLRKFLNLRGRGVFHADIEEEIKRTHPYYSKRLLLNPLTGIATREYYLRQVAKHAKKLAAMITNKLVLQGICSTREFWALRYTHTPAGSSSNRHLIDPYRISDPTVESRDRPNKKVISELLPDDYFLKVLGSYPRSFARQSTKYEPGFKQRALYASDDEATLIASYASHRFEKAMTIEGMCPLQRPKDVLQWWLAHSRTADNEIWLSTDYSDFNKEHSLDELRIVNLAIAKGWIDNVSMDKRCIEKALCSLWIANCLNNRIVSYHDGRQERVFAALWSGSRDTARDNTLLHAIYHRIVCDDLSNLLPHWHRPSEVFMCGDDEDVKFSSMWDAMLYYERIKHIGWHTNDKKQLCGRNIHEFLQKIPDINSGCAGPLCSMVAALASGQWYTQPGLQHDTAVSAVSTQLWEFIVRGAEPLTVYRLAHIVLDAYMKIPDLTNPPPAKISLEWWKYRFSLCMLDVHYTLKYNKDVNAGGFLWLYPGATGEHIDRSSFYVVQDTAKYPCNASNAWGRRWYPLFIKYGCTDTYPTYIRELAAESFGALHHSYIQKEKLKWLQTFLPKRSTHWRQHATTEAAWYANQLMLRARFAKGARTILAILSQSSSHHLPLTLEEKLGLRNMDPACFKMLGGLKNRELCIHLELFKERSVAYLPWSDILGDLGECCMLVDPALRCFLRTTGPTI